MMYSLDVPSFSVSVGYIITTALVMKLARLILDQVIASKYYQSIILEFIATFELLATVFELGVVIERHGFLAYTGLMLVMFNYWGMTWGTSTTAPHPHILNILQRKPGLKTFLYKIAAQLFAGLLVYNVYVKPIWSLGYRSTHLTRIASKSCYTHLQVPMPFGVFVEACATFGFSFALEIFGPNKYNFISLPLSLVSIVYAGMTYTGCYFNPILASTIQFGCAGVSLQDHLCVYWGGPLLGYMIFTIFSSAFMKPSFGKYNNNKKLK